MAQKTLIYDKEKLKQTVKGLWQGFEWHTTPEGHDYWHNIVRRLCEMHGGLGDEGWPDEKASYRDSDGEPTAPPEDRRVLKYGTGDRIPEGATYLRTVTQTTLLEPIYDNGRVYGHKETPCWLVWHYFLVKDEN